MTTKMAAPPKVHLTVHRGFAGTPADHARRAVAEAVRDSGEPVVFTLIRLNWTGDREHPVAAQADLDLIGGHTVHVEVTGHSPHEATQLLVARVRDRLEHLATPTG
jgi:hypothetical protein